MTAGGAFGGRVALVTGATRGIGRAIASRFATEGAQVVITSRDAVAAERAASELGAHVSGIGAMIATPEGAAAAIAAAVDRHGRLDVLVNNAGMPLVADSLELPLERWNELLEANLTVPFLCCQAAARAIRQTTGRGCIVNMGSMVGIGAFPRRLAYGVAKAGLLALTRTLAVEWGPEIRVNAIAPGYTRTELVESLLQAGTLVQDQLVARAPAKRMATTDEIAAAALYLASDAAASVTGHTLVVDGGWLVNASA